MLKYAGHIDHTFLCFSLSYGCVGCNLNLFDLEASFSLDMRYF